MVAILATICCGLIMSINPAVINDEAGRGLDSDVQVVKIIQYIVYGNDYHIRERNYCQKSILKSLMITGLFTVYLSFSCMHSYR